MKFLKINNDIYNLNTVRSIETDKYMIHLSFLPDCGEDLEMHSCDFYPDFFIEFKEFIKSQRSYCLFDFDYDLSESSDEDVEMDPAFSEFSPR